MKGKFGLGVMVVILGVLLSFSISAAEMKMGGMKKGGMGGMSGMKMEQSEDKPFKTVKSGGLVFNFKLIDLKMNMKKSGMGGMDMGGMTHHLMVFIVEEGSGKKVTDAKVKYKLFAPSGKESQTMTMGMGGGYGADVDLSEKGKYGIACMVKTGDKKELIKFNYEVK